MNNAVMIDEKDNVIVAIEPIAAGDQVFCTTPSGAPIQLTAVDDITIYHKIAIRELAPGDKIVKYGEHIGEAACPIHVGQHVHTHNVASVRENLDSLS